MRKLLLVAITFSAITLGHFGVIRADDTDKPKYTTKEVMKAAHAGGPNSLLNKAAGANATKEDKEKIVELYVALSKNKPAKGDEKSWSEKTTLLVKEAEANLKGEAGAGRKLVAAANCMGCHRVHK